MNKIYILCVDDEPDVLEAIERDVEIFEDVFPIELAESAAIARGLIEKITAQGDQLGLIYCDHVMPAMQGVDFLIELQQNERTKKTKKVLVTGQAGLDATVKAVNQCNLNHYIAKPWNGKELIDVTKKQLTDYIIDNNIDPRPYMSVLETSRLSEQIYKLGLWNDE